MNIAEYLFAVYSITSFAFGACVASFLNVCIWRLPREESVVSPPSHCPKCNKPIKWYNNIPVFSWIILRGRCADCKESISPRYMIVEFMGGMLFLLAYFQFAIPFFFKSYPLLGLMPIASVFTMMVEWLVIAGLILGSFIDLDHYYLPDRVTLGGMILGVPLSFLVPELQGCTDGVDALIWSVSGMAGGFLFLWILGIVASKCFKKEAMGFGDVKLLGAVGAFFGPVAALMTIIVSAFVGSIVGVALIARGKTKLGGYTAIPYGPFIAIGVLVWMYWGNPIVSWYLSFFAAK